MRTLKSLLPLFLLGLLLTSLTPTIAQGHPKRVVKVLPRGHVVVHVGKVHYYYHAGVFYRPDRKGFVVVRAPIGAIVPVLPAGYRVVHVHGQVYYCHNGIYYRPIRHHGRRAYMVVNLPLDL